MTQVKAHGPELLWPYPLIWLADHWFGEYRQFMARVSTADSPSQVADAESSLAERCACNAMTAWADACLIPLEVLNAALKAGDKKQ